MDTDFELDKFLRAGDPLAGAVETFSAMDGLAAAVMRRRRRGWRRTAGVSAMVVVLGGVGVAAAAATGAFGSDTHGRDLEYGKDLGDFLDVNSPAFPADVTKLTPTSLPLPPGENWSVITSYALAGYQRNAKSFAPSGYNESVGAIVRNFERLGWCAWGRDWLHAPIGSTAAQHAVQGLTAATRWDAIGIFHDGLYGSAVTVEKAAKRNDPTTVQREWSSLCSPDQ